MRISPFSQRLSLGAIVLMSVTLAYRSIQDFAAARAEFRSECWTWNWLPFHASWLFPYASMFFLVGLPWFMLSEWRQVKRFAVCLLAVAATGWIVFMVYPTACVRPTAEGQPIYYAMLLAVDQPDNCMPCLHSAFSVLSIWALAVGSEAFRGVGRRLLLAVWLSLICISIVALRQHTDIDTVVGFALGGVGAWGFSTRRGFRKGKN